MQCNAVQVYRRFGEKYCLHLQLDSEDEGNMLLRNYKVLHPRLWIWNSSDEGSRDLIEILSWKLLGRTEKTTKSLIQNTQGPMTGQHRLKVSENKLWKRTYLILRRTKPHIVRIITSIRRACDMHIQFQMENLKRRDQRRDLGVDGITMGHRKI